MGSAFFWIFSLFFSVTSISRAGVMLQGFYWDADSFPSSSWWMNLASQSNDIARAGFTAVWIPPVLKSSAGGYSRGYDPFDDYDLGSKDQRGTVATRWGNRDELQRMVAQMRANGVQVILDLNVSHRAGDLGDKSYLYKNAYGEDGKGRFAKGPFDFSSDLPFGRLFNFHSSYVRNGLKEAGEWLIKSLGTQGFRIDSAKHIPADFLRDYLGHGEIHRQFAVIEHWDGPDALYHYLKNGLGSRAAAFDFPLWATLREMAHGNGFFDMRRLIKPGLLGKAPDLAVTFAENDDTDRGYPTLKNKDLSYVFIMTSEGYPSVYWKDFFTYGMRDLITNLMWIHGALAHGPTEIRWADSDLLIYERTGNPGVLVGLTDNQREWRTEWVQTHFGPHRELHDYTGKQPRLWTDEEGKVRLTIAPNSYAAYSVANVHYEHRPASFAVTQEFAGAADLDIKPAENNVYHKVGYVYVEEGRPLEWEITYDHTNWNASSRFVMQILDPRNYLIAKNEYGPSIGIARGNVRASVTGWYRLESSALQVPLPVRFWWKQTYQAPKVRPSF